MAERPILVVGSYVKMNNVRVKTYQGGLELIWSELVTGEQFARGWNRRRCQAVGAGDERAKTIEA